jgi:hypothetical protein
MKPALGLAALLAVVAALAGCEICQAPFDCCNPVIGPGGTLNCDWGARRGSAVHPFYDQPTLGTSVPKSATAGAAGGEYRPEPSQPTPAETEPAGALVPEDFPELTEESFLQ